MLFLEEIGLELRVETHHATAGRLRLAGPSGDADGELGRRIEEHLRGKPGVEEVRGDPHTGRVLVRLRPGSPVEGWLREASPARAPSPPPRARAPAAARRKEGRDADRFRPLPELPSPQRPPPWHALPPGRVRELLETPAGGLGAAEAERRRARTGPNALAGLAPRSAASILLEQISNLPTELLLGSCGASLVFGDVAEAAAIGTAVLLDAGIGYAIERTSEKLLASWRRFESGSARVLRDGAVVAIPSPELVPGDVLLCQAGDVVPADARVLAGERLTCNEAVLTGESEPQLKRPAPVGAAVPLAERTSMLYSGTVVVSGRGRVIVTATGRATEIASVRALVDAQRAPKAPLEKRMEELVQEGTRWSLAAAAVASAAGMARGLPPLNMARSGIALAVAALPEGLPVVVTAALVRAMRRMRTGGMVVRRVSSVETLGGVTVVCADKTGTLTRNDMRLERLEVEGASLDPARIRARGGTLPASDPAALALAAAVLNSDVQLENGTDVAGSSTERAFVRVARRAGLEIEALCRRYPRRQLRERQDGVHYVMSTHGTPEGASVAFVKGAPEQVLRMCSQEPSGPLTDERRRAILARNDALASEGLRVIALAWRPFPEGGHPESADFMFLALAALRDPLRPQAEDAVRRARHAGIRTLILTGDQKATAAAIAREVGLTGEACDGAEVVALLEDGSHPSVALDRITVLSRVTPAHKVRVVEALRAQGHVVAMVGDGVNDAPALKAADVGIAVGPGATDVARQTADVVLANEDLRSILGAVGEGRIVQDNLRRAARYLFATNLSEVGLVLAASLLGVEALSPIQLLWVNILTDTLPALAIAFEPGEPRILDRPPAPAGRPVIGPAERRVVLRDGLLLAGLGGLALAAGGPAAAFAALPAAQLTYAAACRARGSPRGGSFAALVGGGVALHLAAVLWPPLRAALRAPPPTPASLIAFAAGLAAPVVATLTRSDEIVVRGPAHPAPCTPGPELEEA